MSLKAWGRPISPVRPRERDQDSSPDRRRLVHFHRLVYGPREAAIQSDLI